jgi:hypothetical protein
VGHGRYDVVRPQPCGEQRLLGFAHGRIGNEQSALVPHPAGEFPWPEGLQQLPCARRGSCIAGQARQRRSGRRQRDRSAPAKIRVAVDDDLGEECERAILRRGTGRRGIRPIVEFIHPRGVHGRVQERRLGEDLAQESDVGLDAADARFIQRAAHSFRGLVAIGAAHDDLGKQGVEGRGDDCAGPHGRAVHSARRVPWAVRRG